MRQKEGGQVWEGARQRVPLNPISPPKMGCLTWVLHPLRAGRDLSRSFGPARALVPLPQGKL